MSYTQQCYAMVLHQTGPAGRQVLLAVLAGAGRRHKQLRQVLAPRMVWDPKVCVPKLPNQIVPTVDFVFSHDGPFGLGGGGVGTRPWCWFACLWWRRLLAPRRWGGGMARRPIFLTPRPPWPAGARAQPPTGPSEGVDTNCLTPVDTGRVGHRGLLLAGENHCRVPRAKTGLRVMGGLRVASNEEGEGGGGLRRAWR